MTHIDLIHTARAALSEQLATLSLSEAGSPCLLVVGVDRFTRIRGAIGFTLAERLMAELAVRIARVFSASQTARLTPDAIAVAVMAGAETVSRDAWLVEALHLLQAPFFLDGHKIIINLRAGYEIDLKPTLGVRNLLDNAEMALDQARLTQSLVQRFSSEVFGDPVSRLSLLDDLRAALGNGEMQIVYQPQVRARTGEVNSAEALMRWEHPAHGLISPDAFIPTAEETGIIRDLTEWAISRAIKDAEGLRLSGFPMRLSVNISSRLLCDADFCAAAYEIVKPHPDLITFEITESLAIADWSAALQHLKMFSSAGVRLAIDDYGTGMSSLAYVQQLPVQELKIDRQFITQMTQSNRDPLLVRSTIELGHALDLEVVAEGIEDAESLALLTMMGCDLMQGYYIGRPMPLEGLKSYLSAGTGVSKVNEPFDLSRFLAS